MDIDKGRLHHPSDPKLAKLLDEQDTTGQQLVEFFEVGEQVQVKGGWFEVTKIHTKTRQRIVLKPIPRPTDPATALGGG
jgi:hypothetical protein